MKMFEWRSIGILSAFGVDSKTLKASRGGEWVSGWGMGRSLAEI